MIKVTVLLPPDTPSEIVDAIAVSVLDTATHRQPRGAWLESMDRTDREFLKLTFAT